VEQSGEFDPIKSYKDEFFEMFDDLTAQAATLTDYPSTSSGRISIEEVYEWLSIQLKLAVLSDMALKLTNKMGTLTGINEISQGGLQPPATQAYRV
jgi:hypothetical protein